MSRRKIVTGTTLSQFSKNLQFSCKLESFSYVIYQACVAQVSCTDTNKKVKYHNVSQKVFSGCNLILTDVKSCMCCSGKS